MTTTRRRALQLTAALPIAAQATSVSAQQPATRVRLVLAQAPWRVDDSQAAHLARMRSLGGAQDPAIATLIVIPPAEGAAGKVSDIYARIGAAARDANVYLASALWARDGQAAPWREGFLIGPDGPLLRTPKITPEILNGFADATCVLAKPQPFTVARLPFGNVGLLVGEDIFRPTHVRALCFEGAEIILNPATEVADAALPARRDSMTGVAYQHMVHIGVATTDAPSRTGLWDWLGNATLPDGNAPATMVIDIESLRAARQQGVAHTAYASKILPPMVRDGLYGPVLKAAAAARTPAPVPASRADWSLEAIRRIGAQVARQTPEDRLIKVYDALLMQTPHRSVANAADRRAAIRQNITDYLAMAASAAARPLSKLVLFPEFCFTAAGWRTIEDALSVTLTWPGPELELLAAFAAKHSVYLAAQQLELDPKFPGRIFNTAFLFDTTGNLVSRHRKLQCVDIMGTLPDTTPGSVLDSYIAEYGNDSLWQVVDTPIGKLAPLICFENMFPEICQIYAQKGAEVFLHLTSEGYDPITETRYAWNATRRMNAMINGAWFLSVNEADDPAFTSPWRAIGESQAIDPYGRVTQMVRESKPTVLVARVDLNLLRTARSDPRSNLAIWDEPAVYTDAYTRGHAVPNNLWADVPTTTFPYRDLAVYRQVLARFNGRGVFTPPRSTAPPL